MNKGIYPPEFDDTHRFLHEVFELPAITEDHLAYVKDCESRLTDLLARALDQQALGANVRAMQLVTRSAGGKTDFQSPILIRTDSEDDNSEDGSRRIAGIFGAMNHALAQTDLSLHTRIRHKASVKNGVLVTFPEQIKNGMETATAPGMHTLTVWREKANRPPPAAAEAWRNAASIVPIPPYSDLVSVSFRELPHPSAVPPIEVSNDIWTLKVQTRPAPLNSQDTAVFHPQTDGVALNSLAEEIRSDSRYFDIVSPFLDLGPVVVCAPAVFRPSDLTNMHSRLVFDAGLTILFEPGTDVIDRVLLAQIALVAEELAVIASALTGMIPYVQQRSRSFGFGIIRHSLSNALRILPVRDRLSRRVLRLEQIAVDAAYALAQGRDTENSHLTLTGSDNRLGEPLADAIQEVALREVAKYAGNNPDSYAMEAGSISPAERFSPCWVALLTEISRNVGKHHQPGERERPARIHVSGDGGGFYSIESTSIALPDAALAVCDSDRWTGSARSMKGLRLLFELACTLSAGQPEVTVFSGGRQIRLTIGADGLWSFIAVKGRRPAGATSTMLKISIRSLKAETQVNPSP